MAQKQKTHWLGFFSSIPYIYIILFMWALEQTKKKPEKASLEEVILKHITSKYFVILLSIELILLMHANRLRKTGCN